MRDRKFEGDLEMWSNFVRYWFRDGPREYGFKLLFPVSLEQIVESSKPVEQLVLALAAAGFNTVPNNNIVDNGMTISARNDVTNCIWNSVVHNDTKKKRKRSYTPQFTAVQYGRIRQELESLILDFDANNSTELTKILKRFLYGVPAA
jgi:hypothetical protein